MLNSHRRLLPSMALAAGLCFLVAPSRADDSDFKDLFNGKNLDGWKTNVFGKDDGGVFTVKDGEIVVRGNPNGYFYTDKSYKNYLLRFDWKFIKDGNSGLLVHIQNHGKNWPKSLEVQGLQRDHGSIIPISMKAEYKIDRAAQKKAIKIGEWNTTEVHIKNGAFAVKINDIPITTGRITSEDVTEGPFGFQSEGTELHFKNIKIKVLD
jgi:hypothetical protein